MHSYEELIDEPPDTPADQTQCPETHEKHSSETPKAA
jgi:hypothetical protein